MSDRARPAGGSGPRPAWHPCQRGADYGYHATAVLPCLSIPGRTASPAGTPSDTIRNSFIHRSRDDSRDQLLVQVRVPCRHHGGRESAGGLLTALSRVDPPARLVPRLVQQRVQQPVIHRLPQRHPGRPPPIRGLPARTRPLPVITGIPAHDRHRAATARRDTCSRDSPAHGLHYRSPPRSSGALTRRIITLCYFCTPRVMPREHAAFASQIAGWRAKGTRASVHGRATGGNFGEWVWT